MANDPVKDLISQRRSVRTYDGTPLRAADRQKLEAYAQSLQNPFGISVTFRILDAKVHHLSSPKVDIGIALAHFVLTMEGSGAKISFFTDDPGISRDMDTEYIISCRV